MSDAPGAEIGLFGTELRAGRMREGEAVLEVKNWKHRANIFDCRDCVVRITGAKPPALVTVTNCERVEILCQDVPRVDVSSCAKLVLQVEGRLGAAYLDRVEDSRLLLPHSAATDAGADIQIHTERCSGIRVQTFVHVPLEGAAADAAAAEGTAADTAAPAAASSTTTTTTKMQTDVGIPSQLVSSFGPDGKLATKVLGAKV